MKKTTLAKALLLVAISAMSYGQDKMEGLYPRTVKFDKDNAPNYVPGMVLLSDDLSIAQRGEQPEVNVYKSEKDRLGYEHYRYQQSYKGIPIDGATMVQHVKDGKLLSQNGRIVTPGFLRKKIAHQRVKQLTKEQALEKAKQFVGAEVYKWELEKEEAFLKKETGNASATYMPKEELVYYSKNPNFTAESLRLSYKFDIYAHKPISRKTVYVDAVNGEVLGFNNEIKELYAPSKEGIVTRCDVDRHAHHNDPTDPVAFADQQGVAQTAYSGQRNITTSYRNGAYVLREKGRAAGIETYNLQNGESFYNAVDFSDKDNKWNNVNSREDEYATDAHWGAEMVFEYYTRIHNRNSIDNAGMKMLSYVHLKRGLLNAFWDGQRMLYGDGDNRATPLTALEIVGHEFTHGVTGTTSGLAYRGESGALNEAYSDILGVSVEFWAKPNEANWLMGDQVGVIFRNMSNPNQYNNPDTYGGDYWLKTVGCQPNRNNDNCGVHINSGVLNFWFYLLVNGGSGTNDNNDNYNVKKIGIEKASKIAYRTNTKYMTQYSDYQDARQNSIQSAIDIYGADSEEVRQVKNAFHAVGIGKAATGGGNGGGGNGGGDNGGGDNGGCSNPNVNITIKTDKHGEETSWLVKNENGQVVLKSQPYQGYKIYKIDACFPKGCYTFVVKDQYGDGMCCSEGKGSFALTVDGQTVFSGGKFKSSAYKRFCVGGSSTGGGNDNGGGGSSDGPTKPTNFQLTKVSYNSISFGWGHSRGTTSRLAGYRVYVDGKALGVVRNNYVTINSLSPGRTYAVKIAAVDRNNRESKHTSVIKATTRGQFNSSSKVTVTINTDKYGAENSWIIRNNSGKVVMKSKKYHGHRKYTDSKELPKGCYVFDIRDTYGDGMCCAQGQGSFNVKVGSKTVVQGSKFRSRVSKKFCIGNEGNGFGAEQSNPTIAGEQIDVIAEGQLTVSPNPINLGSTNTVSVNAPSITKGSVEVLSSNGQVVSKEEFDGVKTLDISKLHSGLYLIKVSNDTNSLTKKLIIQ